MPQGNDPVADALAGAKDFLANSKFKSATPAPPSKPVTAAKSKPAEAPNTLGDELAEKKKMVQKNKDAAGSTSGMPKMHKGGVVKEDGPHDLEKGEIVIPKDKAMKKSGLLDGMKDVADEKAEPKDKKEKDKKEKSGPHKHADKARFKHSHILHHANGSHTVTHTPHPDEDGKQGEDVSYAAPDMDALHDGMEENLGEPNQGEPEANAEPGAGAGPAGA